MTALWNTTGHHVHRLQNSPRFSEFMNDLLRAAAHTGGLHDADLDTTLRETIADGGVDAAVRKGISSETTGRLLCPTAWQYKSGTYANAFGSGGDAQRKRLTDEVNKPESKRLVENGYGYRLAICDGMPPKTKDLWEEILTEATRAINSEAPAAMVLTEDDLAEWANRFPSICVRFFCEHLQGQFLTFGEWQSRARALVPEFVEIPDGQPLIEGLVREVDLSQSSGGMIIVQGEAGVGKTRIVCEAVSRLGSAKSLVLYTDNDERAVALAERVAVQNGCQAILVADECGLDARVKIENVLRPHRNRARVICIHNTGQRSPIPRGEVIVPKPPPQVVETILKQNYPGIPAERRRSFAAMSGGFIGVAIDLCDRNDLIPPEGDIAGLRSYFHDHYLQHRLSSLQLDVIKALALVTKVGFKADVEAELAELCQLCALNRKDVLDAAKEMKDAPGFVVFAGRYLYVTPQIIADTAFDYAWHSHVEHDVEGFFRRIPNSLIERFHDRVERSGDDQARKEVSTFFGQWTSRLTVQDLADEAQVRRLVQLIEIEPERFLPVLHRLVMETPIDQLRDMHASTMFSSSARREIVWFCERAVIFPEYFRDIEQVLYRLALAESEPNLGNNATNTWTELFRVFLSGTSLPFSERFTVLRGRADAGDGATVRLVLQALEQAIESRGLSRSAVPPVVMGRIPPEQWRPTSNAEHYRCWQEAVDFMVTAARGPDTMLAEGVKEVAISHLRGLLRHGFVEQLRQILEPQALPRELLPRLREALDHFFEYDVKPEDVAEEAIAPIRAWVQSLQPTDLADRLVVLVGQDPWHSSEHEREAEWQADLEDLAGHLLAEPDLLEQQLPWLGSSGARSAFQLGQVLGRLDSEAAAMHRIANAAVQHEAVRLAGGYVRGMLENHPQHTQAINRILDGLGDQAPQTAFELIAAADEQVRPFDRLTQLVQRGQLAPEYLRLFVFGGRSRPLSEEQIGKLLDLLTPAAEHGNQRAADTGFHLLWTRAVWGHEKPDTALLSNPRLLEQIKRFLTASLKSVTGTRPHCKDVLIALLEVDAPFIIGLTVQTMLAEGGHLDSQAEEVLAEAASQNAEVVLHYLTTPARDPKEAWRFRVLKYSKLVEALPMEAVDRWLDDVGVEGARALARSLPGPYLAENGDPTVPEPTLTVLTRFGDDETVFQEFCIGLHSGQVYSGDIAAAHEQEARVAERFLNHELPVIRKWAAAEIEDARWHANRARQEQEEFGI